MLSEIFARTPFENPGSATENKKRMLQEELSAKDAEIGVVRKKIKK